MRGKPSRGLYTKEELINQKKGKDHVARELAKQDNLNTFHSIQVKPIPSHLDYYGKQEWKRVVPLLMQLPIAELDKQMIESYCQLHAYKRRLQVNIEKYGTAINEYDSNGNVTRRRANPDYNQYLSTIKEIRMIANQLGMTINSRLELAVPDKEKEEDHILKLIQG